jgi:hypothetical protein
MQRALSVVVFVGALCSAGCGLKDFDDGLAQQQAEAQPVKLDGEQVVLTDRQIECGVKNDLWEEPTAAGDHKSARLLGKGTDLKFYGDLIVDDPTLGSYAQVRGDSMIGLTPPFEIKDGPGGVKLVTGKAGAVISHSCFGNIPLPIMGIRKGQFLPDAPVQLRYIQDGNNWRFDRIMH